jgi:hypothetical protein
MQTGLAHCECPAASGFFTTFIARPVAPVTQAETGENRAMSKEPKRRIIDCRERLVVICPADLKERAQRAAHENYCSASEWARRVIARALDEAGSRRSAAA